MAKINLLPWRDERRKQRKRDFLSMLGGVALLMALFLVLGHSHVDGLIDYQRERNDFLKQEITRLDQKIKEIKELEDTKARLLARMEIIQQLQKSRPEIVHLFDELAKTVPEGVYLLQIAHKGNSLTVQGVAQSNARVSTYMHNLDASPWLSDPKLEVIETKGKGRERASHFTLQVKHVERLHQTGKA